MASQEIIDAVARKLAQKVRDELVWQDVTAAVGGLSQSEKSAILQAVKNQREREIGFELLNAVRAVVQSKAQTEAQAMLVDDALSLTELERIL
jgi:hypothetical protein